MPYYVTEEAEGCAGYAVVKDDGEVLGCHVSQQDAIDQMVAISLDEGIEPGGFLEEKETEDEPMTMTAGNYEGPRIVCTGTVTVVNAGEGEPVRREISGVAVPYNKTATVSGGQSVIFKPGSLIVEAGRKPKLMKYHDSTQIVGVVQAVQETPDALLFTARISASRDGNDALELVKDGAIDSVSVGVDPIDATYDDAGNLVVAKGLLREISLVAEPAYKDARITRVAATKITNNEAKETADMDTTNTEAPAPAPTAPVWAQAKRVPTKLPTVAEYMSAYVRGGETAEAAKREVQLWVEHNAPISAAAGDQKTADFPGVIPVPILGPTFDNIAPLRPIVTAIGARAMPGAGKTFIRPKIVTHTSVANQANELTGLSSTTMLVDDIVVTKLTFGGTVLVSEQTVDFSDPSALDILLRDLTNQYAIATSNYACNQFANNIGGGQQVGTWDGTSEGFIAKVYEGAVKVLAAGRVMPTHLLMGTPGFEAIGALVDDAKRPLFPTLNPMNASGQMSAASTIANPVGLSLVVDPGLDFAGDFISLGTAAGPYAGFEIYETMKGLVSIEKPDVLGRQISVRGYFAALFIDNTKFAWFDF
jgi:HK97 family phage prohead protease